MTICIEPGSVRAGRGQHELEDDFVITAGGLRAVDATATRRSRCPACRRTALVRGSQLRTGGWRPPVALRPDGRTDRRRASGHLAAARPNARVASSALLVRAGGSVAAMSSRSRPATTGTSSRHCWGRCPRRRGTADQRQARPRRARVHPGAQRGQSRGRDRRARAAHRGARADRRRPRVRGRAGTGRQGERPRRAGTGASIPTSWRCCCTPPAPPDGPRV